MARLIGGRGVSISIRAIGRRTFHNGTFIQEVFGDPELRPTMRMNLVVGELLRTTDLHRF